ncbi:sugar ABC transporter permease [Vallitalea pronyensis]|uniref:Sugar ABC transporter permease n=2 Tax=Vallitalea pronyensis TaxID=1348613 RepID=A0A8J8MQB1_9FIRM|nr:sugar ABC transporter permease [Vallitalea pronyensis]
MKNWRKSMKKNWQLYVLLIIPVAYLLVFRFAPMLGLQIVFKDFKARLGIFGSPWCDPAFKYFIKFFNDYNFVSIIKNTLVLSIYGLIAGFPLPIILALSLHYTRQKMIKKTIQMITYAPYFISVVVIVGLLRQFFQVRGGFVNQMIQILGFESIDFFANASSFPHMYVWSGIWQGIGFGSIIYIAALAGVDPSLHEAAVVDGATKLQRIRHIDIPSIMPTAVTLLILSTGQILNIGFEKVLLMQNSINTVASEVISTYVYKTSFESPVPQYSYSTAINLFQSLIGIILILIVNKIAQKYSESSLF